MNQLTASMAYAGLVTPPEYFRHVHMSLRDYVYSGGPWVFSKGKK